MGKFYKIPPPQRMASPMRGSCRRRRLMRWTAPRRWNYPHLIRHGFAVPPSPHRGRQRGAPHPLAPFSGELSPKVTERSSQICCNLSVSAFRRATSPERGGFFAIPANFLYKFHKNPIQTLQPHTVHGTMTLYFPEMAKKRVPAFLLHKNAEDEGLKKSHVRRE